MREAAGAADTRYEYRLLRTQTLVATQPLDGGAPQVLRGLAGQWLLVVVDSGACAEACEQRLFMQRQLREMNGRDRDRIDKLWLVIDDAPVKPALQQALAGTPGMHMLRVPRATVAAWLTSTSSIRWASG